MPRSKKVSHKVLSKVISDTAPQPKTENKFAIGIATGVLIAILAIILIPTILQKTSSAKIYLPFITRKPTPTPDLQKEKEEIGKKVLPEKLELGIAFKDSIIKLVQKGAIDKNKFLDLYQGRGGMTAEYQSLFEQKSDDKIVVTPENAGLILNLLWPLGITNKTSVLALGPMGTQYKDSVGNFASTGGWTIGTKPGGELFNSSVIFPLTEDQEKTVKEIAENIYRPCCGNSTYFPDCNHGAAMLGYIELAVAQGLSKDEIYKKALVLNSYWFPQTYAEVAMYMLAKKGVTWEKVDAKEMLGANFSSGQGYVKISKELQDEGLIPKVQGGGSCGV